MPIVTPNPQQILMFVAPPLTTSPGMPLLNKTTVATTPAPNRIKTIVPINSARSSATKRLRMDSKISQLLDPDVLEPRGVVVVLQRNRALLAGLIAQHI